MADKPGTVVVVGGGIAGLTAAAELIALNFDVTLVEASEYLGGRVKQVKPFKGCNWLDLGGEFIHGEHTSIVKLANDYGWEYEDFGPHEGSTSQGYVFLGKSLVKLDESCHVALEARKVGEEFEEKGRQIRKRLSEKVLKYEPLVPENSFDSQCGSKETTGCNLESMRQKDVSLEAFLDQYGVSDENCRSLVDAFYGQTDGNDLSRIGMLEFSRSSDTWPYGSKNFRLKQSYKVLLDHIIKSCSQVDVRLDWRVKEIDWQEERVYVTSESNEVLKCDYTVIAVPLTVLKDRDITFRPCIYDSKAQALEFMEMRGGCKMFCCFSHRFWLSDHLDFYFTTKGPFRQVWNERSYKVDGRELHVLCGFATGSAAEDFGKCDAELLKDDFLAQLDAMFRTPETEKPASDSFVQHYFYDWGSNPYVRGCYSSPTIKSYGLAEKLAEQIGGRLFFAGEATNAPATSTIESAIDSGKRVAAEILAECAPRD